MNRLLRAAVVLCALPSSAHAYIDTCPALGKIINDATNIVVMQVEKVSLEKRVIVYKKVSDLKGAHPGEQFKHQITDGIHPREPKTIIDWAESGKTAILFSRDNVGLICIGHYWYECSAHDAPPEAPWWRMVRG